uniref:Neuropeptide-like 1 n=1 Tax=Cacopsylla melanoneura TaxID=428564 RepID=A0A8D8TLL2_9HEMI
MCRAKIIILLGFTIFLTQANDTPSDYDDYYSYSKRHLSSLARDGLIPGKRYVASLIKNVKPPEYYKPHIKKFSHPFHVFQQADDLPEEEKRYLGTVLAKVGQNKQHGGDDKRSLMDGMVFGEDLRRYLQSIRDKKYDSFSDDMETLLGDERVKKSYGVDGMVFGEDFRRINPYESTYDEDKRNIAAHPMLRYGKRSYGVDGLIFGEDMRKLLQQPTADEDKRGFNSLMDPMVLGQDLRNQDSIDNYEKRGYSLMDGMIFGEDLRNKAFNNYDDKRGGHGLMDGMVFAEDLRKAIQEAKVRKEQQKTKNDKDIITGQKAYPTKTLSQGGGKRSVQALAREGYLSKVSGQGKRAGVEAMARNGLLKINGKTGKRAGLEALARNGYLNTKCTPSGQSNKRGISILAKNGILPKKSDPQQHIEDLGNLNDENLDQDYFYYYNNRPRPYLSYFVKRPFLGHRISSAWNDDIPLKSSTRNVPLVQRGGVNNNKYYDMEDALQEPDGYEIQKRYVATLLKEAGAGPAKINTRGEAKSIEESEEDVSTEEDDSKPSKRSYNGDSSLSDEYTMPVMQNSGSRDVDEVMTELARLSGNNSKRYYAVKGGGRILGGRLQELGKQKQNQSGQRG